jgi:hypothetical protein
MKSVFVATAALASSLVLATTASAQTVNTQAGGNNVGANTGAAAQQRSPPRARILGLLVRTSFKPRCQASFSSTQGELALALEAFLNCAMILWTHDWLPGSAMRPASGNNARRPVSSIPIDQRRSPSLAHSPPIGDLLQSLDSALAGALNREREVGPTRMLNLV